MTDNHDLAATEIEFGSDYSQQLIVGTLGAIAGGVIVAIAFALVIYFNPPSPTQSQLQTEYYRGVYDVCSSEVGQVYDDWIDRCNNAIGVMKESGEWFEKSSQGYLP